MQHSERLEALSQRFDEIEAALANPSGTFDQTLLLRRHAGLKVSINQRVDSSE